MAVDSAILIPILAVLAIAAVVVCALFVVVIVVLGRRSAQPKVQPLDLTIDVASLDATGPSGNNPQLMYLGKPVRLAALVIAPVGRSGAIPAADQLLDAVDQLIPGLVDVISIDHPVVRFWPGQLSTQGFARVFFRNVTLPGERGVGTRWCSVAGKFRIGGQLYLAGLLCVAGQPNAFSEVAVEDNDQWARVLEVRRS
jgi:hypothetical protein